MKLKELQELQEYIEELKRQADVGYLEAEVQVSEYYYLGYKNACESILEKIERLEEKE